MRLQCHEVECLSILITGSALLMCCWKRWLKLGEILGTPGHGIGVRNEYYMGRGHLFRQGNLGFRPGNFRNVRCQNVHVGIS